MSANDNHRSWAKHYDLVNRMCFGRFYDELTRQTLAQINAQAATFESPTSGLAPAGSPYHLLPPDIRSRPLNHLMRCWNSWPPKTLLG